VPQRAAETQLFCYKGGEGVGYAREFGGGVDCAQKKKRNEVSILKRGTGLEGEKRANRLPSRNMGQLRADEKVLLRSRGNQRRGWSQVRQINTGPKKRKRRACSMLGGKKGKVLDEKRKGTWGPDSREKGEDRRKGLPKAFRARQRTSGVVDVSREPTCWANRFWIKSKKGGGGGKEILVLIVTNRKNQQKIAVKK